MYRQLGGTFHTQSEKTAEILAKFFSSNDNIRPNIYLKVGIDNPFGDYLKNKTLKRYIQYWKTLEKVDIDSADYLQFLDDSVIFIKRFCKEEGIRLSEYITYSRTSGGYPIFLTHIKQRKISLFVTFLWVETLSIFESLDPKLLVFYTGKVLFEIRQAQKKLEEKTQIKEHIITKINKRYNKQN